MKHTLKHFPMEREKVEFIFSDKVNDPWNYFFIRINFALGGYTDEVATYDKEVEAWCEENVPKGLYAFVTGSNMFHLVMLHDKAHQILFKLRFG